MKTSVFMGTSVDGFIARPNGDLDFLAITIDLPSTKISLDTQYPLRPYMALLHMETVKMFDREVKRGSVEKFLRTIRSSVRLSAPSARRDYVTYVTVSV